ncbi:hypothetical protein BJ742DRAFT_304052 [Cladochytrium replicatum]|nr:hypothetical protein BJ742DRAFT_304052 [Cladochytrium replicatum]
MDWSWRKHTKFDKGPKCKPGTVLGGFRHKFEHRTNYLRVDEEPDSSEYLGKSDAANPPTLKPANAPKSSGEGGWALISYSGGFVFVQPKGEPKREWKMDDREETISGGVLYGKLSHTVLNLYSGYFDMLAPLFSWLYRFMFSFFQNDTRKKGKSEQNEIQAIPMQTKDKRLPKRYGVVPREWEASYTEDDLRAFNPLWKTLMAARINKHLSIEEETIESLDEKHLLYQQGIYGDNIFLVACLLMYTPDDSLEDNVKGEKDKNYKKYANVVAYLLTREKHRRTFINSEYEGSEYLGETAMHAAIVHDDLAMLRKLWEYGADLEFSRAQGRFFQRGGTVYYGQSLLGFAVCLNRARIVKFLLEEAKVDPNSFDHYGNTPLHMLCWWGLCEDDAGNILGLDRTKSNKEKKKESDTQQGPEMMSHTFENMNTKLGSLWKTLVKNDANPSMRNYQNLTPFLVAVHRRNVHIVWAIIEDSKLTVWDFGRVAGYRYPLTSIDLHQPNDNTENIWSEYDPRKSQSKIALRKRLKEEREYFTALELAVHNRDAAMIANVPLFRIVLETKWIMYAQSMFLWYLLWFLFYQAVFLAALSYTPLGRVNADIRRCYNSNTDAGNTHPEVRKALDSLLLIGNIISLIGEIRELALLQYDFYAYFNFWADGVLNILQWSNIALFVLVVIFRFTGRSDAEMYTLTALSLISWLPLFYYFQGFRVLGPLIAAVSRMRFVVFRFLAIFFVLFMGFAVAFWIQMADRNSNPEPTAFEKAGVNNLDFVAPIFIDYSNSTSVASYMISAISQTQLYVDYTFKLLNTSLNSQDEDSSAATDRRFGQWWGTVAWSLGVMLQTVERYDDLKGAESQVFAYILLLIFTTLTVYILVNILIAMMNSTYSEVIDEAGNIWRVQW